MGDDHEITWKDDHGHHHEDYVAQPNYAFSYGVEDHHTGDYHGQKEHRDGKPPRSLNGECLSFFLSFFFLSFRFGGEILLVLSYVPANEKNKNNLLTYAESRCPGPEQEKADKCTEANVK